MRLTRHRRPSLARLNMTPMIDIVFLMLVFFLTVSQVSKIQEAPVDLPKQLGSQDQRISKLTINVTASGEIIVLGERYSTAEVVALVGAELTEVVDPSRVTVVLRCDQAADSAVASDIMESLQRMGIRRVYTAVETPAG